MGVPILQKNYPDELKCFVLFYFILSNFILFYFISNRSAVAWRFVLTGKSTCQIGLVNQFVYHVVVFYLPFLKHVLAEAVCT